MKACEVPAGEVVRNREPAGMNFQAYTVRVFFFSALAGSSNPGVVDGYTEYA